MTCLVVAMHQDNAQIGWLQFTPILNCHIVSLTDVVYVNRDAGVSTWRGTDRNQHVKYCHYYPSTDQCWHAGPAKALSKTLVTFTYSFTHARTHTHQKQIVGFFCVLFFFLNFSVVCSRTIKEPGFKPATLQLLDD